jgi:HAD superfamily hydrolase (TIGR01450 family)
MQSDPELRRQLAGVRALVLDMDGVLVLRGRLIPGVADALGRLTSAGIPWVIGTNTSIMSRETISREMLRDGLAVDPSRIVSSGSAAAAYVRRTLGDQPIYVLCATDGLAEFDGLRLLAHDEAAAVDAHAAAVVIGDAADEFTPRNMQSAFTLLRGGARFVAVHRNRWWITQAGVQMDAGAYVAALEFGTQKHPLVTGKPARTFFAEAVRVLMESGAAETAGRVGAAGADGAGGAPEVAGRVGAGGAEGPGTSLAAGGRAVDEGGGFETAGVAMVGDDVWNDVRGAQKAGLRGIFVRSGKHGDSELARASAERGGRAPDAIAASIVEVVDALLG